MSLTTSNPLDKTLESFAAGRTASGQTYGEYLFSWMANMHDHLSRTPGVQVMRTTITLGAGDQSLEFAWDFGRSGKPLQTTMTGPSTKLGKSSGLSTDAPQPSKRIKPAPSSTTSTASSDPKSSRSKASSQSRSGYTTTPSESVKSTKPPASTTGPETLD